MISVKAKLFLGGIENGVCSPFFDKDGNLHAILQSTGDIVQIDSTTGEIECIHSTDGQPGGATFDDQGMLYVADFAHGAVLAVQNEQQDIVVAVYEDKPLKGPHSIIYANSSIYFSDSGPLGETGLHSPTGSLFSISSSPSGQILKPISLGNLANPTGIAVSPDGSFIYVAEMMMNRVLRFFQQPEGVYHGSVFYQMSGGVGPSCLAIDRHGSLYIGQYDTKESSSEGTVLVLSKKGNLISSISINTGPEISGLSIMNNILYITEKSSGSIFRMDL